MLNKALSKTQEKDPTPKPVKSAHKQHKTAQE